MLRKKMSKIIVDDYGVYFMMDFFVYSPITQRSQQCPLGIQYTE